MSTDVALLMTAEEFLELPHEEDIDRELIDGHVVEKVMTTRNPRHAIAVARIGQALNNWIDDNEGVTGVAPVGDVRCRLTTDPDTVVGIDIAYFEGDEAIRQSREDDYFSSTPTVAVEVLSPTDTHEEVTAKLRRYLRAGVPQVWIADPDLVTVTIHRAKGDPSFFHRGEILDAEPDVPGFRVRTELLFGN